MLLTDPDRFGQLVGDAGGNRAVAAAADVPLGTVANLRAGRRKGCTRDNALRLADVLGVPARELFEPRPAHLPPGVPSRKRVPA